MYCSLNNIREIKLRRVRWAGNERDEKYVQNYSREISREEITWEIEA
jgi:hypothetical protein